MSVFPVRLPDVGEGVAEAELVEWLVAVGDRVTSDSPLAEVLTDKATVEIYSPVEGVVSYLRAEPGDTVAVGTEIVGIETDGIETDASTPAAEPAAAPAFAPPPPDTPSAEPAETPAEPPERTPGAGDASSRPLAAPTVRRRAREAGVDLGDVTGSGPGGRIVHDDLDTFVASSSSSSSSAGRRPAAEAAHEIPIRGLRRRIADRLTAAWTEIPHITYVDEFDATDLEHVRRVLNTRYGDERPRLTLLPFLLRAIVLACREQPRLNATFDAGTSTLRTYEAIHVGIATQTDGGLVVPVVRHVEALGLWEIAAEVVRLSQAAREGRATRDELTGSTITVSSLGALGGLVTTPIINQPEVAIIGVNKLVTRPRWRDGAAVPRTMCNLSSSFDHRIVDGWDAATFVGRITDALETPALLFMDDER